MMTLEMALTLHERVYSLTASDEETTYVFVERHFHHTLQDEGTILEACFFGLVVTSGERLVESIVCRDFGELEDAIITNIHGGRELRNGRHWNTTNPLLIVNE